MRRYTSFIQESREVIRATLVLFGIFLIAAGIFFINVKNTDADSVNVILNVQVCNANTICEAVIGENYGSCPSDCEAPPTPTSTPTSTDPGNGNPPPADTGGSQTGSYQSVSPEEVFMKGIKGGVHVAPYRDKATIQFETYLPVLLNAYWGKASTYEMGASAETIYHQKFNIEISNLSPGTTYYFKLHTLDTLGRQVDYESYFTTTSIPLYTTLPTISGLSTGVFGENNEALLTWVIPNLPSGERVRLTRMETTFPKDPYEGRVVYEGRGERVIDSKLEVGKFYYYSLFVIDDRGAYSAPAISRFRLSNASKNNIINGPKTDTKDTSTEENSATDNGSNGVGLYPGAQNGLIYDPLLQNPQPVYIETRAEDSNRLGFCGYRQSVLPALSLMSTVKELGEKKLLVYQDGKRLEPVNGIFGAKINKPLVLRVDKLIAENSDDRVGICLTSKQNGNESYYLFTKNTDGDFELVFPAEKDKTVEKKHYQFTLGMLKFSGQEEVFGKGEIAYISDKKESSPIGQFKEILLLIGGGSGLILGIRFVLAFLRLL